MFVYLETDIKNVPFSNKQPDSDSIIYKLDMKPDTEFYDWMEQYLQRSFGDYLCVDVQELARVSFGITRQGLVKSGRIRHTKDDRHQLNDRRNYVLGWSNIEKIKALENVIHHLQEKIGSLQQQVQQVENEEKENKQLKQALAVLLSKKEYLRIDWQYHGAKITDLKKEQYELLHNNDILTHLQEQREVVEKLLKDTRNNEADINKAIGAKENNLTNFKEQHADASNRVSAINNSDKEKWFPFIAEKMAGKNITLKSVDNKMEDFRKEYQGDSGELKKLRSRQGGLRSAIERKMREIKEHSKAEYSELAETIDARTEYMDKFEKLQSEDLKRHEERFKEELTKNTINSIAVFDSQLEKHEKISNKK